MAKDESNHPENDSSVTTAKKSRKTIEVAAEKQDSTFAVVSLTLGLLSLTGPGLLLGIPAIIFGAIALKRNAPERGMSITGIISGAISTFFSLLLIAFFVLIIVLAANNTDNFDRYMDQQRETQSERRFQESRT